MKVNILLVLFLYYLFQDIADLIPNFQVERLLTTATLFQLRYQIWMKSQMIQILFFYRLLLSTNKDCIWRPVLWAILSLSMKCRGWSFAIIDLHDGLDDLIRPVAEKEVSTFS